jgi:hypothetical protein
VKENKFWAKKRKWEIFALFFTEKGMFFHSFRNIFISSLLVSRGQYYRRVSFIQLDFA